MTGVARLKLLAGLALATGTATVALAQGSVSALKGHNSNAPVDVAALANKWVNG